MGAARVGDSIELAGALSFDRRVVDFLEIGERGIHHARARAVEAARTLA
jgi:hypothetical protein